jgi:hypothetical protein
MASGVPKGWEKDSDKLFIHETGIRIARMTYKGKDGWFLVPVDLDAVETALAESREADAGTVFDAGGNFRGELERHIGELRSGDRAG